MFGKQHTFTHLFQGIAIAALLAVVAVPSALAGGSSHRHADRQACENGATGWITVTDDQGLTSLAPTGQADCTSLLACTAAVSSTTRSPYPGWAFTTDDQGLPWLVPALQSEPANREACTPAQAAPAAAAATQGAAVADVTTQKPASTQSPYPGWVFVTDDVGLPYLVPAGHP